MALRKNEWVNLLFFQCDFAATFCFCDVADGEQSELADCSANLSFLPQSR